MSALARTTEINCDTRAVNEDCINGGSRTRTKFTYDAFGSPATVVDSLSNKLHSATYAYGIGAFQTASTDIDAGPRAFTVDPLGEVTAYTDAKSQAFSTTYDALSRPLVRTEPDLTTIYTWGNSATSDNIGQLASVTAASGAGTYSESNTFDSLARPSTHSITIPGDASYTYTQTYNATTGLLDTLQYPVSTGTYQLKLQYAYSNGIESSLTNISDTPHVTVWSANTLNPRGQWTEETLGNGVMVNRTFDALTGWLGSIKAGVGGGNALQNNAYLYDEMGDVSQRQDNNAGVTENVFYDTLYRLDHTVGDTSTQMSYDAMGRIATWAASGGTANVNDYATAQAGCTYYANSQLHALRKKTQGTGSGSYCYDANGNMTSTSWAGSATQSMTWTSFNQPNLLTGGWPTIGTGTSTSQFFYDENHQRYKQIASSSGSLETTYYVGGLLEKMVNPSGTFYRHYIPAGSNTVLYTRPLSGTVATYYLMTDNLGSTTVIADSTGKLLVSENYAALGWHENAAAPNITRHEFTGQEGIINNGLWMVNMNGRLYSPSGGAYFLSPDPHTQDPGNTQSWNRYSYVHNNPLTLVDPTGFDLEETIVIGTPDSGGSGFEGGDGESGSGSSGGQAGRDANAEGTAIDALKQKPLAGLTVTGRLNSFNLARLLALDFNASLDAILSQLGRAEVDLPTKSQTECKSSSSWYPVWAPHGFGGSIGFNAAAGVNNSWSAAKTGSYGGGQFFSSNTGANQGTFTTSPGPNSSSSALLASASGGASFFITNAQSVQQLGDTFTTDSLDIGLGPFQIGAQLSYGGGIWQFSVSPPFAGLTAGISSSQTTTNTVVKSQSSNGCGGTK
jgi:RHS repeat-associated protein